MVKYYKGRSKHESTHIAYFKIYDEIKHELFHDYIVEVNFVDHSGRMFYKNLDDCNNDFIISKEISKEELEFYERIQIIITEIFMNQLTGGFPREANVTENAYRIYRSAKKLCEVLNTSDTLQNVLGDLSNLPDNSEEVLKAVFEVNKQLDKERQ